MSVDKAGRCGPLLTWLRTFRLPSPCAGPQDLSSGLAVAHALSQIDPAWFTEAWLQGIAADPGTDWKLKVSNLRTILQSLVEYFQDMLGHPILEQHLPDVTLIGEFGDPEELGKLLQLVLGCAISCERKQEHIQQILTLEQSVQQVVMEAIQELLSKDTADSLSPETYGNFDTQSRKYYFLSEDPDDGDELRQRCLDLERQLVLLAEEKQSLAQENAVLRERGPRPEGEGAPGLTAKKLLLLQTQLEQLQEENFRLESGREDERLRCLQLEREVADLRQRNQALGSLAQEAQALKDEMDELRQSSERAGQLEATLSGYQRRLGELRELRRQVRQLEERNAGHADRTRQLEEELRRAGSLRAQLEAQRRQVQDLQSQRQEEAVKADKWLFECRNLQEKYDSVTKEKERLLAERDSLREANEELRCAQLQPSRDAPRAAPPLDPTTPAVENLAAEILPAELRETLVRLQLENKRLCRQEAADRERQEQLQRHLEEARRQRHGLETRQRLSEQQVAELRAQVEQLQRALQEREAEDPAVLKRKLEEHLQKLLEVDQELQDHIQELEPLSGHPAVRRGEELRAVEERYRRYVDRLDRARSVMQPEPEQRPPGEAAPELQALRMQLRERAARLRHREMDFEKSRSQRELEEKLLISAWYNMGMALQQRAGEHRAPAHAQSFLAQQRLATNNRRGHLGRLAALNLRPPDQH